MPNSRKNVKLQHTKNSAFIDKDMSSNVYVEENFNCFMYRNGELKQVIKINHFDEINTSINGNVSCVVIIPKEH